MSDQTPRFARLDPNVGWRRQTSVGLSIVVPPIALLLMPLLEGLFFPVSATNYEWQIPVVLFAGFGWLVREFKVLAVLFCWAYFVPMYYFTVYAAFFLASLFYSGVYI